MITSVYCQRHFGFWILDWGLRIGEDGLDRMDYGEAPEWPIGAVSKPVVGLAPTVSPNPTLSAEEGRKTSQVLETCEVFT